MQRTLLALGAIVTWAWPGLCVVGCDEEEVAAAGDCEEGQALWLTAGQTIPVGGLYVQNDDETLFVSYETTDGWVLDEVHLSVGCSRADIPTSGGGNPIPGQFEWSETFSPGVTSHTFVIPLSSLSCEAACGQELTLAAHAAVSNPGTGAAETAWGSTFDPNDPPADAASYEFGGSRWGWYAPYVLSCCEGEDPPPPADDEGGADTGWAYEPGGSGGYGGDDDTSDTAGYLYEGD